MQIIVLSIVFGIISSIISLREIYHLSRLKFTEKGSLFIIISELINIYFWIMFIGIHIFSISNYNLLIIKLAGLYAIIVNLIINLNINVKGFKGISKEEPILKYTALSLTLLFIFIMILIYLYAICSI